RLAGAALDDRAVVADVPDGSVAGLWRLVDVLSETGSGLLPPRSVAVVDPSGQAAVVTLN
ncbi:MAG TPA: hypothetical protein PKW11_16350, partial [Pseudomonadota bacterium]|nr:hypothetical protein [Pseudomonadota bacterium]